MSDLRRAINHIGWVAQNPESVVSGLRRPPPGIEGWLLDLHEALGRGDKRSAIQAANKVSRYLPEVVPEPLWRHLLEDGALVRLAASMEPRSSHRRILLGYLRK